MSMTLDLTGLPDRAILMLRDFISKQFSYESGSIEQFFRDCKAAGSDPASEAQVEMRAWQAAYDRVRNQMCEMYKAHIVEVEEAMKQRRIANHKAWEAEQRVPKPVTT